MDYYRVTPPGEWRYVFCYAQDEDGAAELGGKYFSARREELRINKLFFIENETNDRSTP